MIFRGYDYLGEFSHSHVNPIYIERIQLPESDARKHYIDYLVETYDKQYLSDYNTATHKEKNKTTNPHFVCRYVGAGTS